MTYRFKCRDAGDVLMLQPDGDTVLRLIGKGPAGRGIIEPAALPEAIAALEQAVGQTGRNRPPATKADALVGQRPDPEPDVSLRQRAWPLLRLLKSAQAAKTEVTWGI